MTNEDYVSFETAKLLKEKGFDENTPVNYFVGDDKPRGCAEGEMIYHKRAEEDTHLIAAPTLQKAMKWLREVHNITIGITFSLDIITYEIQKDKKVIIAVGSSRSYEVMVDDAIKYCLKNLI